jgi:hypothetical protein
MESASRREPPRLSRFLACGVLALAFVTGCAGSRQLRGAPEESGFLGDYSQLQPGGDDRAKLVYIAPDADLGGYDAIIVDSVTLWPGADGHLQKLSREDQQSLADAMYHALVKALEQDYRIVTAPAPQALRLRAALTEAQASNVPLDVVATVIPQINLLTRIEGVAANTSLTVGEASAEMELTDSVSGRRLAAAVDERVGVRRLRGMTDKWSDVQAAFDAWAEQLRKRLAEERAK